MLRRLILLFFTATLIAHAQSVRWEPASGTLAFNQTSELSLVFEQCEPSGDVDLPDVQGLVFDKRPSVSQQTSYSVVNFKATANKTTTYAYRVRPKVRQPLTIPSFTVETDKGPLTVKSATFDIGEASVGDSSLALDSIAQSKFKLSSPTVWAGEVFNLGYTLNVARRYFYQLGGNIEWKPSPLIVETWSEPKATETTINSEERLLITNQTRAYVPSPGEVTLSPANQLVNLVTGSSGFGLFARQNLEQFAITSAPATLKVRPLPTPAPSDFKGMVGQFTLESKVVPATANVGEPITWTLTLSGTGNWPDIAGLPTRSVSKDFRIVQPQAKRTNKEGALFDASVTEDIILISTKPGTYTMGPVNLSVFNPTKGIYENITTAATTITITGAAASTQTPPPASMDNSSPASPPAVERAAKPATAIPRDPIPSGQKSLAPFPAPTVIYGSLAALLLPLLVWIRLALRRARDTDPARPLREAHQRLIATLNQLSTTPDRSAALLNWQRETAILWKLARAVPTPSDFNNPTWATLWAEADRALYSSAPLPDDWITRAQSALHAHRPRSFSFLQLFLLRNLLPLLVFASLLLTAPSSFAADTALDAYAKADYAAAETAWAKTLQTTPTDWTAHHNLSLALIQQNRASEAAGHALAAFVQQPQNESVRWNLAYTFKTAGVTPSALAPFINATPAAKLAQLAPPTQWQGALIAAAWLGALTLSLILIGAYRKKYRTVLISCLALLSLGLATLSAVSLFTYGPFCDARAVVVVKPTTLRSIPTDLETPQKSSSVGLGVVANTDKTFLGWSRLVFPDGQTGWVRSETIVRLWQ